MNPNISTRKRALGITLLAILGGFIFLVPQLPPSVDKRVEVPFINGTDDHKALIFFGFSACQGVCLSLDMIIEELI